MVAAEVLLDARGAAQPGLAAGGRQHHDVGQSRGKALADACRTATQQAAPARDRPDARTARRSPSRARARAGRRPVPNRPAWAASGTSSARARARRGSRRGRVTTSTWPWSAVSSTVTPSSRVSGSSASSASRIDRVELGRRRAVDVAGRVDDVPVEVRVVRAVRIRHRRSQAHARPRRGRRTGAGWTRPARPRRRASPRSDRARRSANGSRCCSRRRYSEGPGARRCTSKPSVSSVPGRSPARANRNGTITASSDGS